MKPHHFQAWKARYDFDNLFGSSDKAVHVFENGVKMHLYRDNKLSFEIVNGFELDEVDFVNRYLGKGDTFVDIGTNVGLFSLHAATSVGIEGRVISFEPSTVTVSRLKDNIQLNGLGNIEIIQAGLSSEKGELELTVAGDGYDAFNSFAVPFMGSSMSKELVQVMTLDGFMSSRKIAPADVRLMKIDVEGWELHVLRGAADFLGHSDAPVLLVEFTEANAKSAGSSCIELGNTLGALGYQLYTYDAVARTFSVEPFGQTYSYRNLIASKQPITL